jgi:hypothetical protein
MFITVLKTRQRFLREIYGHVIGPERRAPPAAVAFAFALLTRPVLSPGSCIFRNIIWSEARPGIDDICTRFNRSVPEGLPGSGCEVKRPSALRCVFSPHTLPLSLTLNRLPIDHHTLSHSLLRGDGRTLSRASSRPILSHVPPDVGTQHPQGCCAFPVSQRFVSQEFRFHRHFGTLHASSHVQLSHTLFPSLDPIWSLLSFLSHS